MEYKKFYYNIMDEDGNEYEYEASDLKKAHQYAEEDFSEELNNWRDEYVHWYGQDTADRDWETS
jgi:hypothetical protein